MNIVCIARQGHRHGVSVFCMCVHLLFAAVIYTINYSQPFRKLLSSSNNYFIEFENQEHLKIKGRDMSCPYGFREPIICVDLLYCAWQEHRHGVSV
ncbi:hypothetical protein [Labilibaculum manganireducens]|uniref:hypothetical protein n=1 Tax=Labilibaculum manganireducens TaxID=1940525 RepID=UPI0029F53CF8|nr:hypothetical protein [Labilibaculum manganireducens]